MTAKGGITAAATKRRAPIQKFGAPISQKVKKIETSEEEEEDDDVLSGSDSDVDNEDEVGQSSAEEGGSADGTLEDGEDEDSEGESADGTLEDGEDEGSEGESADGTLEDDGEDEGSEGGSADDALEDGDDEGSDVGSNENASEEEETEEISGWADSMAKILKSTKPKHKKVLILSRAKKDYEIRIAPPTKKPKLSEQLEIDGVEVKEEEEAPEDAVSEVPGLCLKTQRKLELKQKRLEKQWENLSRKKPEDGDVQVERALLKIATKGVVQLFNAVAFQQKTVKGKLREVRNSEFKKDKILSQTKDMFNSTLKKSGEMGNEDDVEIKEEVEDDKSIVRRSKLEKSNRNSKKPTWQALQDDFMLDAKMKDWDRSSGSDDD